MTQGLEVVALHHSEGGEKSNEGIPFRDIKAHWNQPEQKAALTAASLTHLL